MTQPPSQAPAPSVGEAGELMKALSPELFEAMQGRIEVFIREVEDDL